MSSQHSQGRENFEETTYQAQSAHQQGATEKSRGKRKSKSKSKTDQSGSDTETEGPKMSSRSSKASSSSESTKKHRAPQNEDWSEVTDPEERRRIQNRIAQRKFRGKAKEQREKSERDQRNVEHAGDSYRVPEAGEMTAEEQAALSGLPWGGLNVQYAMGRGPESGYGGGRAASHRASDPVYTSDNNTQYLSPYTASYQYTASTAWDDHTGSSSPGGDQLYYDNGATSYYYDYDTSPRQ
ncbi:hypothetical protein RB596_008842 [Gaeumannomyces avenae]